MRWFRDATAIDALARDNHISRATGYRYLHEGIDVPADQAPDLRRILDRCLHQGMAHTILDGTLITTDRITGVRENGNDLWFSQKHKAFGGNLQFLSAPNGTPLGVSDAEPGSTSDITAARIHALPDLYKAAAQGLPVLADKGYQGAGIGVRTPIERPTGKSEGALRVNTRMYNALLRHVRALGERTAAELKERWRALKHVTLSPCRIGDIARAALVLNGWWKGSSLRKPQWCSVEKDRNQSLK